MYAVIDKEGKQYKVELGEEVLVDRLEMPVGELIEFGHILLVAGEPDREPRIGQPYVEGARVLAEVMRHERGKKVMIRRFRKQAQTTMGHRQDYTRVKIREIIPE